MTIYLGADHGGFAYKQELAAWLTATGYRVQDCGAETLVSTDDYPQYAAAVARAVAVDTAAHKSAVGFLFCRSGGGMAIAANKIAGARAVDVMDEKSAKHARNDNDANIATFAGDWLSLDQIKVLIAVFLATPASQEERHARRVEQIKALETDK